jgi:hypothetical protein
MDLELAVLLHYFSSAFQRTNGVFLSQQISISISISQISVKRTGQAQGKFVTS